MPGLPVARLWVRMDSNHRPAEWITPFSATVSGSFISTALPLSYCSVNKSPGPGGGPGLSLHKYFPQSERIYRKPDVCHRSRRACVILGAHSTWGSCRMSSQGRSMVIHLMSMKIIFTAPPFVFVWNSQDSNLGHYSSIQLSYCSVWPGSRRALCIIFVGSQKWFLDWCLTELK